MTEKPLPLSTMIDTPSPLDSSETWEHHLTEVQSQPKNVTHFKFINDSMYEREQWPRHLHP
jgi:hypothetical protein